MVEKTQAEQGQAAARLLWKQGVSGDIAIEDPLSSEFSNGALDEFEILQQGTPGVLLEVLAGAEMSAEQLDVAPFQGVLEVVQNADDLGATEVRIAIRAGGGRRRLLIVHDGDRVHLDHVVAMTLAFVSTKRQQAKAKGRFGIGLKTLARLSESMTVHCDPYHFTIAGNNVSRARAARSISGFFDASSHDTMLDLELKADVSTDDLAEWLRSLGPESLVFLDSVRSLRLVDLGRKRAVVSQQIRATAVETVALPGLKEACERTTLRDPTSRRTWDRYEIAKKMPSNLKRTHKARSDTTPIAVVIPNESPEGGRLYAGLPLGQKLGVPMSFNAQFDIDVSRHRIQRAKLNLWLFDRLADLLAGVALDRFLKAPATGWASIPMRAEIGLLEDQWLHERLDQLTESVQKRVKQRLQIEIDGELNRIRDLVGEDEALEGLLTQADIDVLAPGLRLIPSGARDPDGRWRQVLDEVGGVAMVTVADALALLEDSDARVDEHDVRWFIRFAHAAINADLGHEIFALDSVVTEDGRRVAPVGVSKTLLVRRLPRGSLAAELGVAHVIEESYVSRWSIAVSVRKWLEETALLSETPTAETVLEAIASRSNQAPTELSDAGLRMLRDAFEEIEPEVQEALGSAIGRVVSVEVQHYDKTKRVSDWRPPMDAYLPASIDDRKDGWAKAAAMTPEIPWIHPRYEDVLRRPGRGSVSAGQTRLGAKAFFALLGAETAPRLHRPTRVERRYGEPAAPIAWSRLPPSQREALAGIHASHLRHDWHSPELEAVLRNIEADRNRRSRRDRAMALLATLERDWDRLYAARTKAVAVRSEYRWTRSGETPTTWLAWARDRRWMTDEKGRARVPDELMIRSPVTAAIFGDDKALFASDLTPEDSSSSVVHALGIHIDPPVSELVDQLAALQEAGDTTLGHAQLRYQAISASIGRNELSLDDRVGDLTVRQLRSRFGGHPRKPGLVLAGGQWQRPSEVFVGPAIFGNRRLFVPRGDSMEGLWRVLGIARPSVTDCLDVLDEIATDPEPDDQVMIGIYDYIETRLPEASAAEATRTLRIPLWTGASWRTERPVFLMEDRTVSEGLSASLPMWHAPVVPASIPNLIAAADVTLLGDNDLTPVVHMNAEKDGEAAQRQFRDGVRLVREWLARADRVLYQALAVSWEELENPLIALDQDLQLEFHRKGYAGTSVPAVAHVTRDPLTFYFSDWEAIGDDAAGGRVVSSLFEGGDRDKLALGWAKWFKEAKRGLVGSVSLAENGPVDDTLDKLLEQSTAPMPPRRSRAREKTSAATSAKGKDAPPPVRRLKDPEAIVRTSVAVERGSGEQPRSKTQRRGLKKQRPEGSPPSAGKPAPKSAPLAYSTQERDYRAIQVVSAAINGPLSDLRDFQHLRGVGADALDKVGRAFEFKTFVRDLPDEVTLSANEVELAVEKRDSFILAVVAGLEEGYETIVKLIPDPLRSLHPKENSSLTLNGIRGDIPAMEVRFVDQDVEEKG